LGVLAGAALNFENLVSQISPVAISSAAMVEEKGWLSGFGIFEPGEQFSALDSLGALLAVFQFRHDFLAFRESLSVVLRMTLVSSCILLESIFGIVRRINPSCHGGFQFRTDVVKHQHGQEHHQRSSKSQAQISKFPQLWRQCH
jgi:hypothetical protein